MTPDRETSAPGFTIWVDADACPREIRDLIELSALRRRVRTVFVANSHMSVHPSDYIEFELVAKGSDVADQHIVDHAAAADLAVTGDIPLAARLVERGVFVINTRGEELTEASIGERLAMRNLLEELRSGGMVTGGPREMESADARRFANALDRFLTRRLKSCR